MEVIYIEHIYFSHQQQWPGHRTRPAERCCPPSRGAQHAPQFLPGHGTRRGPANNRQIVKHLGLGYCKNNI